MKKLFLLTSILFAFNVVIAQQKPTELDKSPLDVAYYPANFPILKMKGQINGEPLARILYSRPQKKGREIFGEEVKYNEIWRMGANEATEVEFFKNVSISGKKLSKGRYTLYCIPAENRWTLVFNKDNYSWGSFSYKNEKDAARIEVPVTKNGEVVEALTMYFDNAALMIMWDNLKVAVPVNFN